ncbi:MAG: Asp23/Gls24 family envelope stress response protein [Clostridia bacterium]|nr:Asp23/Gls24 family envelope stress response protein [Clostridia bacterium]
MKVIAFVGESGTGKSYRAAFVAKENGADAIIDDGLLISGTRAIFGISAKKAPTRLQSVREALFLDKTKAKEMSDAIYNLAPSCLMILGTSKAMAEKIAGALSLPAPEKFILIEDVATPEEIQDAKNMRFGEGKHIIPLPAMEIKKDFSGYFLHPFNLFFKEPAPEEEKTDKTIVRPTFSYLGDYTISDNVVVNMVTHEAMKCPDVKKVNKVNIRTTNHGAHIDITLTMKYGRSIPEISREIQLLVKNGVEKFTSINVRKVHIYVKNLI